MVEPIALAKVVQAEQNTKRKAKIFVFIFEVPPSFNAVKVCASRAKINAMSEDLPFYFSRAVANVGKTKNESFEKRSLFTLVNGLFYER